MFSISLPIIAGSIRCTTTLVKSKPIPAKRILFDGFSMEREIRTF